MLVKEIYDASALKEEFKSYDRDYYSYEACQWFLDLFDDGTVHELDVIAICYEFDEQSYDDIVFDYHDSIADYIEQNYSENLDDWINEDGTIKEGKDIDELLEMINDYLNYNTLACQTIDNCFVYSNCF